MRPPKIESMNVTPFIHRGGGIHLLLGTDYEREKQRLRQERHLDYKQYLEKKKHFKTAEPSPRHQGLSLLIDERTSVKEKLKEERNKEYNLFLQERAHTKGLKRGAHLVTSKLQASNSMCRSSPDYPPPTSANVHFPHREQPASKRDAASPTEAVDNGKSPRTGEPRHQRQSRWNLPRPKEIYYSSEEEFNTDKEEELSHSMKQNGHAQKPDYKVEKITREHRAKRGPMDVRDGEASGVHDQNNNNWVWKSKGLQMQDGMKTPARSRPPTSKDKAVFATGLMIGTVVEQEAAQMRKEHYKQELLKQIAEHEKNKRKEKELELKVAATGITDPEKRPDRIKQFGAVHRKDQRRRRDGIYKSEIDDEASGNDPNPKPDRFPKSTGQRGPPRPAPPVDHNTSLKHMTGKTGPETEAAPRVPPLDVFNEDYHRDVSDMLGEVTVQRVAGAPPPVTPTVTNTYKTPYDEAYYYYGTRNPLDPSLPYSQNDLPGGTQQSEDFQSHPQRQPPLNPSGRTDSTATDQHGASLLAIGELSGDREKQKRDSALRNQEELRQQIKEKKERKRKEKELFDAKLEAEMMAYNPWGRSGGGAPIRDQSGNLVSDLYRMHRINEESDRNLISGDHRQRQKFVTRNGHTPGVEARAPLPSQRKPDDLPGGTQQSEDFQSHPQRQPPLNPSGRTDSTATDQHGASLLAVGELSGDWEKQKRDSALRNQEELRQQIKEKKERKRKEKELLDAKLEAEMMAYNPWGRSGGGAPIRDQSGNLVSDLYRMHRINEESDRNLISGDHRQRQKFVTRNGHTPGVEARAPLPSQRKPDDLPGGTQQSEDFQSHPQRQPPLNPSGRTDSTAADQHGASLLAVGELSGDWEKQKRDSALRNQEELRQQIKEKKERKRKEKELLDAKLEAEMMAYNPWGRSGGGAPIRDQSGNLVSDLYRMHRINEESDRNLISGDHRQRQKFVTRNGHTPGVEARAPLPSQRKPGFTESDQWQPQGQDNYKEDLRLQLSQSIQTDENRRKKVEEKERIRTEEKEEKRLAEKSARFLQEYEEEQRKQKIEHRPDLQAWVHKHNKHHRQDERKVKREENRKRVPEGNTEKERNESPTVDKTKVETQKQREPSPPIPTLQKKRTNTVAPRPPSAVSHVSPRTEHSVSAPHVHPVPVPKLQDGQQEVLRELSTLRRYLRKEQRQLEVELAQTDQKEAHFTSPNRHKRQAKVEAAELLQKKAVQPPTRRFNSAHVNMKNIRDFNKLKYRDTVSREEVCHMYPDPPTDAQSLDIQQQALLREQRRRIQLLRTKEEHDILDQHQGFPLPRNNARHYAHRDSILPSETAFIGVYSGDAGEDFIDEQRSRQPSAQPRERTAQRRRRIYDEVAVSVDQMERDVQPDTKSLQPDTNLNLEAEFRHGQRRDSGTADHKRTSEGQGDDEVDVLSLRSTPSALERRVSVETVATEPWLRPGTSDAVKHSGDRPRPGTRTDAPPRRTHRIT